MDCFELLRSHSLPDNEDRWREVKKSIRLGDAAERLAKAGLDQTRCRNTWFAHPHSTAVVPSMLFPGKKAYSLARFGPT
jgi:hypothetical protein